MALINREELFVVFVSLNVVILQHPPPANAHSFYARPFIHTVQKTVDGALPSQHPLQPSVTTLCGEIESYENYCAERLIGNVNQSALAMLTLDLGEKQLSELQTLIFETHANKDPLLLPLIRPRLTKDASFTFKEARMLVNHPKTLANAERIDAVGQFPRLADLLRTHSAMYKADALDVYTSMDRMEALFYVAYALTLEVVWRTK